MIQATDMDRAIDARRVAYQRDPIEFAVRVLGLQRDWIWPKMVEMAEAIRDHRKVCIRAGHSVSKTFSLGRIIVPWFKTCFLPSTVVTTAPSDNQVKNQLWREIHAAHAGAKVGLGGTLTALGWDMTPSKEVLDAIPPRSRANWAKNFAIGFSTSPDSAAEHATKMAGWHNEHVLVVIDEACGMAPQIWRTAVEGLLTDERCRMVAIGNPTDPECEFARACHSNDEANNDGDTAYVSDTGWHVVTIDARSTPNYQERRRVIPGLASYDWVQTIFKAYGENGDGARYRVKGLFPTYREGTYYGRLLAQARKEKRIGPYPADPTHTVWTFSDFGDRFTATAFAQFIGGSIRIVDSYWDNEGKGAPGWAQYLKTKEYTYAGHFAGPDLDRDTGSNKRSFQTGRMTQDVLSDLGFKVEAIDAHPFKQGIEVTRGIWPIMHINDPGAGVLIQAAAGYGKRKSERLSTKDEAAYHDQPAKTWHMHMMDALRHLAVAFRTGRCKTDSTDYQIVPHKADMGVTTLLGV